MPLKRILVTIPNLDTAGSVFVVADILEKIKNPTLHFIVCVSRASNGDSLIRNMGIEVVCSPFHLKGMGFLQAIRQALKLVPFFRRLKPDLWHSWNYDSDFTEALIARLTGTRKWMYTKKSWGWEFGWRLKSLLASKIIINNPRMEEAFFSSCFFRSKVVSIPQGADTQRFRPAPASEGRLREKLGIARGEFIIGCVANLFPNKNQLQIIESLPLLTVPAHLVLVGRCDTEYAETVRKEARRLGLEQKIHFFGFASQDTLPEILCGMDLFVFTSLYEGLPVSLLEAMACAKACVSTINEGAEAVIDDGVDGFLVDRHDAPQTARALQTLMDDDNLRKVMGQKAREKVLNRFDSRDQARMYEQLYLDC